MNIVLITSIIDPPNKHLSYTSMRSYYTSQERFEQTKKTIETVRKYIPNIKILLVECSYLNEEQLKYFINYCDYFINLIDDDEKTNACHSISKSLGEGTMTIAGIEYLQDIDYEHLFKLSGRYWLSEDFNYEQYNNPYINIKINDINDAQNVNTCFYKIPKNTAVQFCKYLESNYNMMYESIGYEFIFGNFLTSIQNIKRVNKLGVEGYVSVAVNEFVKI